MPVYGKESCCQNETMTPKITTMLLARILQNKLWWLSQNLQQLNITNMSSSLAWLWVREDLKERICFLVSLTLTPLSISPSVMMEPLLQFFLSLQGLQFPHSANAQICDFLQYGLQMSWALKVEAVVWWSLLPLGPLPLPWDKHSPASQLFIERWETESWLTYRPAFWTQEAQ